MSENVKTRTRAGSRRSPATATEAPAQESPVTEVAVTEVPPATDEHAPDTAPDTVPDGGPDGAVEGPADGVVGWADAVPWLALRWGSAPTAAEVRFAPVVWQMLQEQGGRTALQMAADAELAGYTELDPTVLARVLARYERAGVVRTVTDGRLSWWSVVDPAEIVAEAQESARASVRAGASAARTGRAGVASRVGDRAATPAGGLRGLVEDHLAEHPFEDFSPTQVAKAIGGRSSGAVANALERLVEHGAAIQTSASPRRYQHRPDPDATPVPATGAGADEADGVDGVSAE